MAGVVQWIDGRANQSGAVEKIFPSIHIKQNQWDDKLNEFFVDSPHQYPYISDYECAFRHPLVAEYMNEQYGASWQNLQAAKLNGTSIPLADLAHFTEPERANDIIDDGGFRGGMKKINEDERRNVIEAELSWWSPKFSGSEIDHVRDTLRAAIEPFVAAEKDIEEVVSQFAKSHAFMPSTTRYGNFYFKYGFDTLCKHYENYRREIGKQSSIQFKILGTYVYKLEIMHAVLVCSNEDKQFLNYPNVTVMAADDDGNNEEVVTRDDDGNNEEVVTRDDDGNWVWKPQATATEIVRLPNFLQTFPIYRRWEHVAFAFYTPDGVFELPDLEDHRFELT